MAERRTLDAALAWKEHMLFYHRHDCTYAVKPYHCDCGTMGNYDYVERLVAAVRAAERVRDYAGLDERPMNGPLFSNYLEKMFAELDALSAQPQTTARLAGGGGKP